MPIFSRRDFLKGIAVATGSAIGTRAAGSSLLGEALAADEPTSVVVFHLIGGLNQMFTSGDSIIGKFGVTSANITMIGGIGVDNTLARALPPFARTHMAAIGVDHGISGHPGAQQQIWSKGNDHAGLVLAHAMGGAGSIKAAQVGDGSLQGAPRNKVYQGVSFQKISDLEKTIAALGGGAADPRAPNRAATLTAMEASRAMSENALSDSAGTLLTYDKGLTAAIDTLKQPVQSFDLAALRTAYGFRGNAIQRDNMAAKFAGVELMVRAGVNVISVYENGWDTHADPTGQKARNQMAETAPALGVFLTRMLNDPARNVVFVLMGDFSRSLQNSDHQPNLTATIFGKYVKPGTTGRLNGDNMRLPANTPGIPAFWACVAAAAKAPGAPFGDNPHRLIA